MPVRRHHLRADRHTELCHGPYGVGLLVGILLGVVGVLWFLFYLLLAANRKELTRLTGALSTLEGIYTGWLPGYLLLVGAMPGGPTH